MDADSIEKCDTMYACPEWKYSHLKRQVEIVMTASHRLKSGPAKTNSKYITVPAQLYCSIGFV